MSRAENVVGETDSRLFGKAGSVYDFSSLDYPQTVAQCRELEASQKSRGKKVNTKVMNMIEGYVCRL